MKRIQHNRDYLKHRPKPAYIWKRYELVKCADGFLIVDNMSERYSNDRMWISGWIECYTKATPEFAQKRVRFLNHQWHKEIERRKQNGEF